MKDKGADAGGSSTTRELARLRQVADVMRAQLLKLQHDLVVVHRDTDGDHAARLLDANTQLVQAALLAQTEAASALHGAGDIAQPGSQPLPDAAPSARERPLHASQRDLREANTQLLVAALEAQTQEADAREDHRRQIQYMAMVAHELRNPLAPIRSAASLLNHSGTGTAPSLPRLQAIIERQVEQMSRLIEDLLEGSRISSGKLRLELADVDLIDILELAVLTCRPGIHARGQSITLEIGPPALPLHGDPVRLVQVFCNLLDNASKYTPAGGEITVAASSSDGAFTVRVRDNGVGISPLALTRIFDLFVQDDHDLAMDSRGLGIGLAVVRELVDSHGGSVTAHSAGKGKGSEFVVTLPMREQAGSRQAGPGSRQEGRG